MTLGNRLVRTGLLIALFFSCASQHEAKQNFTLGFLLPYHSTLSFPGHYSAESYAQALLIALKDVKDKGLLPNVNLKWVMNKTQCNELRAIRQQFYMFNNKVDALFGPGCHCVTAGRNAAAFNIPMMSYKCLDSELADKEQYPTVARTSTNEVHLTPPLLALLRTFNWRRVAVIVEDVKKWQLVEKYLVPKLKGANVTVAIVSKIELSDDNSSSSDADVRKSVRDLRKQARIVILLMQHSFIVEYVHVAYEEKLVQSGEYVFIGFQMDINMNYHDVPMKWYFSAKYGADKQKQRMDSFASVLIMEVRRVDTPQYDKFKNDIKKLSRIPPFNSTRYYGCAQFIDNKCMFWKNKSVPSMHAGYLYDAVYTYAIALNKSLTSNETVNGRNIIKHLKGLRFKSIFGYDVAFDENADVGFNLTLLDQHYVDDSKASCDLGNKTFNPNKPCKVMRELADFWPDPKVPGRLIYVQKKNITKLWQGRVHAPKDSPKCGFDNELCETQTKTTSTSKIIGGVSGALAVLLLLLVFNIYRQYRMEKKLHSLLWKIDYKDINYERQRHSQVSIDSWVIGSFMQDNHSNSTDQGKRDYQATDNLIDDYDDDQTVKFTTVGLLKGNYVAIKKLSKKSVDLTRTVLKELNLVREIRHDNLNLFIGACVDTPNICIITSYCSKGSLQDILENGDVKLDHMFNLALLYDIIKGMTFLHGTEIKFHGNLKSSNCLIDSRWQLKLTDYGLDTFKSKQVKQFSCDHAYYRDLLWKAPELLRSPSIQGRGSQMGDVYSFGIILQEMHTRNGPYGYNFEDVQDIVEKVKAMECPPYRPVVPNLISKIEELRELMKECWADIPQERPTFNELKKRVHKLLINNKVKTSIMDNMIYMMEKYTDNLQELVVERTGQLVEEKRKTDALLERMLPPSVAEQLKKGKAVEAESFSSVTIYFSDIVSFTELCAESTPLQVVSLLNDLYTLFDEVIREFDVYKVETIGDAYMVVSGLPQRNNNLHASEICCMAIRIRDSVQDFKIRHKPDKKLELRIGIHSGPVVAGVVGRTMPRYCLFGDTVNTASRLESSGEALSIHISSSTKETLDKLGGFHTEERGKIPLKGKGSLVTYWLLEADENVPRSPHREMNPSEPPIAKHTGPGLLMKEFHNSTMSLRGSMRGSFRNSPAICRNGGVNHDSPVIMRWKKPDEEPNGHCRDTSSLLA